MVFFEWKEEYETGVPHIDLQHTMIVNMINELFESIGSSAADYTTRKSLEKLLLYVEEHFASEEAAMREYDYPAMAEHVREHEHLRAKVEAMHNDYHAGGRITAFEMIDFLKEWFRGHIAEVDGRFGRHFRKVCEEARKSYLSE